MPPIELDSLTSFLQWLQDAVIAAVPLGLSPRLRPLLTSQSSPTASPMVVLVRPHIGHALLSLSAGNTVTTSTQGHVLPGDNRRDGGYCSTGVQEGKHSLGALTASSYASLVETMLQLTRADGHISSIVSAAVDGVGRKVMLYAALLGHCAEWWRCLPSYSQRAGLFLHRGAHHTMHALHSSNLPRQCLFFDNTAAPLPMPMDSPADERVRRQQLFLRVLQRLRARGGWRLRVTSTTPGKECDQAVDWLDYAVQQCVACDLQPAGDYLDLSSSPPGLTEANQQAASPVAPSPAEALGGVLWHVLATEVEGEALTSLYRLLGHFLLGVRGMAPTPCMAHVRRAAQCLVRTPEVAFTCYPGQGSTNSSSGASSAALPPVAGPLVLSRVLPPLLCVLPFSASADGSSSTFSSVTSHRFYLLGAPSSFGDGGAVRQRAALRVLLLRVDPEHGWLPTGEELASQRTFHASYQKQAQRDVTGRGSVTDVEAHRHQLSSDDSGEAGGTFAHVEARCTGTRHIYSDPASPPLSTQDVSFGSKAEDHSSTEDCVVSFLSHCALCTTPFREAVVSASERDRLLWRATVRLYALALLHQVRVVLTPEKLPALTKGFGYRHLAQLHRTLRTVHDGLREDVQQQRQEQHADRLLFSGASATVKAAALALLHPCCMAEAPIAVYVVDQVDVQAFAQMQEKAGQLIAGEGRSSPLLPVVLCRDVLRCPLSTHLHTSAATMAAASLNSNHSESQPHVPLFLPGVCGATHCGVLDEEVVCRAWAAALTLPEDAAADALMDVCAGTEQHFIAGRRNACFLALAPLDARTPQQTQPSASGEPHDGFPASDNASRRPSILLVAPTDVQALYYVGLMRKAALALLEALSDPVGVDVASTPTTTTVEHSCSLRGVVRGGGAFHASLIKQLHALLRQLAVSASSSTATPCQCTDLSSSSPPGQKASGCTVQWGTDVATRDYPWIRYTLYLLCEACASVATRLAQPIIERETQVQGSVGVGGAAISTIPVWLRGPQARRALWMSALRSAVESPDAPPGQPVLRVCHPPLLQPHGAGMAPWVDVDAATSPYAAAMRLFAPDSLPSPAHCQTPLGRDGHAFRLSCSPPLFEPLHSNVRTVREALSLLFLTLSAAA